MDDGVDAGLSFKDWVSTRNVGSVVVQQSRLPIAAHEASLGRLLNAHQVVLVLGETGSGKSTQIPQMVHRLGWTAKGFRIACVQPNRITALRLADRLALEMGEASRAVITVHTSEEEEQERQRRLRTESQASIVVYDQEALLRNGFWQDPKLSAYSLLFLDEIHERFVALDLLFGLIKRLLELRSDLRLVLGSATLDTTSIMRYFDDCALLVVEGRQYPIHVAYLRGSTANYLDTCISVVLHVHKSEPRGDVLVFVPSREECEELVRTIQDEQSDLLCVPLHSGMTLKDQQIVISATSSTKRKIIISTEIAETSLSIPNVMYVVDCMFVREVVFDSQAGLMSLVTRAVSRSKADQRAGRAGRLAPGGKCFRLCTELAYRSLPKHDDPMILRSDLVEVVLWLKQFGVDQIVDFPYMTVPTNEQFIRAFDILYALGAVNDEAELTSTGYQLARLPLSASLGKTLLTALTDTSQRDVIKLRVLDLVSMIGSGVAASVIASCAVGTLANHGAREGDHLTLCNLARAAEDKQKVMPLESFLRFRAFRSYIKRELVELGISLPKPSGGSAISATRNQPDFIADGKQILQHLVVGFFMQVAKLQSNGLYKTAREGRAIKIHASSVVARYGKPPEWICFHEAVLMSSSHRSLVELRDVTKDCAVVRLVSAIDPRWLLDLAPHFWRKTS